MTETQELTEAEKVAKIARFGFDKPERRTKRRYPDARGWRTVHRIPGKESECDECTTPVVDAEGATK